MQEPKTDQSVEPTVDQPVGARVPTGWKEHLQGIGPGVVMAFAWLGTGDLINSSVSGANYGYALMWGVAIALLARYFFTSAISKYHLCNRHGDESILHGYGRVWRGFPLLLGISAYILGFTYASYLVRGAGTSLYHLFGEVGGERWGIFIWSLIAVAAALFILARGGQYRPLEWFARIAAVALVGTFLVAVVGSGIDFGALIGGLTFELPPREGLFGSLLVVVALIGAVGGSSANLLYPYFMSDKGWRGPGYRKLQKLDLLTGIAAVIVINLLIWVVAAETMQGAGMVVENEGDLAVMMERAVGSLGPTLLWIGVFFITFTTFPAYSRGFTKLLVDSLHISRPARRTRHEGTERDPLFRWFQLGGLIVLPLTFALPFMPNLVVITLIANTLAVLTAPIIMVGILIMTNRRSLMMPGYTNKWWENIILLIVGGIGLWATYGLITSLPELIGRLVG